MKAEHNRSASAMSAIKEDVANVRDDLRALGHDVAAAGTDAARSVADSAGASLDAAGRYARRAQERTADFVGERPLTSVLLALGVGAVLGGLFFSRR